MMNCTELHSYIDDFCDGELSAEQEAGCEAHLASCSECARAVADQNSLSAGLKAMPVPGPSEGFAERALLIAAKSEVVGQSIGHHRQGFMVGFGSAAAAALALWVVVGVFPQQSTQQAMSDAKGNSKMAKVEAGVKETDVKENVPEFSIALNEQRDIKLAFYSSEALKGARITLQMPENVALVGYEGRRKLAWKTNLAKGDNTLRLPIIATSGATSATGGQMVAHIEYKGKVRTLKVNLTIGAANVAPDAAPELSGSTGFELRIV